MRYDKLGIHNINNNNNNEKHFSNSEKKKSGQFISVFLY